MEPIYIQWNESNNWIACDDLEQIRMVLQMTHTDNLPCSMVMMYGVPFGATVQSFDWAVANEKA